MKNCPYCFEEIKPGAVKCRYCGEWLNQQTAKRTASPVKNKSSDSNNSNNIILSRWKQMSFGVKVLTVYLAVLFVVGFVGIIIEAIEDNNREVSQKQTVQKQKAEQQAAQEEALPEKQKRESLRLLLQCQSSCSSANLISGDFTAEYRCMNKCEQEALTRNIEIEKLREMQKQRRQ